MAQEIELYDPQQLAAGLPDLPSKTYDELVALGRQIGHGYSFLTWMLGDIAVHIEIVWGQETLQSYAAELGYKYETIRGYRWVSQQFPPDVRRLTTSWSVHQALASLPLAERLRVIGHDGWTVDLAREHAKKYHREVQAAQTITTGTTTGTTKVSWKARAQQAEQVIAQRDEADRQRVRAEHDAKMTRAAAAQSAEKVPVTCPDCTVSNGRAIEAEKKVADLQQENAQLKSDLSECRQAFADLEAAKAKVKSWASGYQHKYGTFDDIAARLDAMQADGPDCESDSFDAYERSST
jgi:hypothetical protein